jgi:hypothetical protein
VRRAPVIPSRDSLDVNDDPYDPSCALAFLQDQTNEVCLAVVDQDGKACEYCTLQGALALCLTEQQAVDGQTWALGVKRRLFFKTVLLLRPRQRKTHWIPLVLSRSCKINPRKVVKQRSIKMDVLVNGICQRLGIFVRMLIRPKWRNSLVSRPSEVVALKAMR